MQPLWVCYATLLASVAQSPVPLQRRTSFVVGVCAPGTLTTHVSNSPRNAIKKTWDRASVWKEYSSDKERNDACSGVSMMAQCCISNKTGSFSSTGHVIWYMALIGTAFSGNSYWPERKTRTWILHSKRCSGRDPFGKCSLYPYSQHSKLCALPALRVISISTGTLEEPIAKVNSYYCTAHTCTTQSHISRIIDINKTNHFGEDFFPLSPQSNSNIIIN